MSTDRTTETTELWGGQFCAQLRIQAEDALQRADLWTDLSKEFLSLAMLVDALRGGVPQIGQHAANASRLCWYAAMQEIKAAKEVRQLGLTIVGRDEDAI